VLWGTPPQFFLKKDSIDRSQNAIIMSSEI
jgi:hypothetical protein